MHSHLLAGLDDGVQTLDEAVALVRQLSDAGYTKIVTTPHIISGLYHNHADTILPALDKLRARLEQEGIKVELEAAAEYMLDDYFEGLLADGEPLLKISNKYLLTEFSFVSMPFNYREIFFNLKMAGYEPILAHPERFRYLHDDFDVYRELHETGIHLQVNLLSLKGHYGRSIQKVATQLLEEKLVTFVGTDIHHQRHVDVLSSPRDAAVSALLAASGLKNHLL
ncbi:histidinol phosphatase [Chitinophaga horti]|uniref:protein-tyrosine-phosphatase n=1 Tax=Chitinophaga horti TaxID=2920382 RepID=A0ABY6IY93_9BACT|nr:CpsB/CapC family capsule biosynthesis tyrosine phosphatase [Chitinophaga horti]UYQ92348.1 histidinol phosphatase [Chitinophaga horti]